MISDRLKECLTASALTYVLLREVNECYLLDKVVELADIHINNFEDGKYIGNAVSTFDKGEKSQFKSRSGGSWQNKTAKQADQIKRADTATSDVGKAEAVTRCCYNCQSPHHIARNCPEKKDVSNN